MSKYTKLPQPKLLDFTKLKDDDEVKIVICNTQHQFSTNAAPSGTNPKTNPIFGTITYINDKKFLETSYGFPFIRFKRGSKPKITYRNDTKFTFNIHYHGLNTVGSIDGTAMELLFGNSTMLGPEVTLEFPKITNNYALLWFHSHNMFISIELIYAGLLGLLQIVDDESEYLTKNFEYSNNQILLSTLDMDFNEDGTQTSVNLPVDENRSCFSTINGISAVSWYDKFNVSNSCNNSNYVNLLCHKVTKNVVKIDILNGALNWRVVHVGVCDKHNKIKPFYLVQTDGSLINPKEVTMAWVPVAGRISLIFDLNDFKDNKAYLFYYNYDLTEIFGTELGNISNDNNTNNINTLIATTPDFNTVVNATPYPTPIPSSPPSLNTSSLNGGDISPSLTSGGGNQQQNPSKLNYPPVKLVDQINQPLENGQIPVPKEFTIKKFLKIKLIDCEEYLSLSETIRQIRKIVFGKDNYEQFKHEIVKQNFEYEPQFNYISLLNDKYFYNLPNFCSNSKYKGIRNIMLFSEMDNNCQPTNPFGTTECVNGANRIMCDLWNSDQLDLDWALQQYNLNPNNFKPPVLPTSKFRIFKTNDEYSNAAMISNDTLKIQFFNNPIYYGDNMSKCNTPIQEITIIFPETGYCGLLNIQEWIDLVNDTFDKTAINLGRFTKLSQILQCDWSFYPYSYSYLTNKAVYIKSAIIKTINKSNYFIKFSAKWTLLQFFGKSMTGDTLNTDNSFLTQNRKKYALIRSRNNKSNNNLTVNNKNNNSNTSNKLLECQKNPSQYIRCDEEAIYGIYDNAIEQFFPFYATNDQNVQLPIACMKRSGELIITSTQTFIGIYDGYSNPNLWSFGAKFRSTETWNYINLDTADSHPIHFHLTSGFASISENSKLNTSNCTVNPKSNTLNCNRTNYLYSNQQIYSRDIYQVGPNQEIAFDLTWPHYPSSKTTESPEIRCLGGVIHCHFLPHNDVNSMMVQYFVDNE